MLCVGTPLRTLCVRLFGTRSVPGCIPTRSVRNDLHSPRDPIVPMLCVGTPLRTLCVRLFGTRSVPGCVPTRSVRNDLHSPRDPIVPMLCVGTPLRTLCVRLFGTRSVPGCVPTRSVRNDLHSPPRPDRSHALRGNDRNVKAYMTCQPSPNALYNATLACTRANRNCTFMSWAAKRVRWVSSTVSRSSAPAW